MKDWWNMQKKASEILNEIQHDILSLKKTVELLNFQYSMILERLNSINNKIGAGNLGELKKKPESIAVKFPSGIGGTVTSPESPPIAMPIVTDRETSSPISARRKQIPKQEFDFNETVYDDAELGDGMEEVIENKTSIEKIQTIPVTQILYTPLGKPMTLAKVEVINPKGKIVQKTRTNSAGRWQALLEPGVYQTHIVRRYNETSFDFTQDIKIGEVLGSQVEILAPEEYQKKGKAK